MIMQHIDRSRGTGGGMAASFVIHGGLLLLLALVAGRQAAVIQQGGELTEIAYIEARYGEDVAAKVKIKEKAVEQAKVQEAPRARPEPPARGVNTDSAVRPAELAVAQAPRPQPKPAAAPAPQAVVPQAIAPRAPAPQAQLAARAPAPAASKIIPAQQLVGTVRNLEAKEVAAPRAAAARPVADGFAPASPGLKSKTGTVALGQDLVTGPAASRQPAAVAEGAPSLAAGGGLKPSSGSAFQAPAASLVPAGAGSGATGGQGVLDVAGPAGAAGGPRSGRKTILDYGGGGGGGGAGSLSGRQRIVEPSGTAGIVAQAPAAGTAPRGVAEAELGGKGVNMTITGQIQGRRILTSVPPEYSAAARKNGWEGVVAVHFTVKADGRVKDNMYFDQTSVHRDLNQAAMAALKQFVFAPLGADQAAVEQWGVITIVFRLN